MEFGKVADPGKIEFRLPPDDALTDDLLRGLGAQEGGPVRFHVGGTNWGTKDWLGILYPKKTKERDFLAHYSRQFNTVELNTLFYSLQPVAVIEKWAAAAEKGFQFCPKFSNSISHARQLEGVQRETDDFIAHVRHFGEKLGPSFLQLSDKFGPERAVVLQRYLRSLPRDLRVCVELRQPDWFKEGAAVKESFDVFRELGIGTVITDTSGRRDCLHMRLTAPWAFIRFVGNNAHPTDLTRLDEWADRIKSWMDRGLRDIYFFIHSHNELHSPELGHYAINRFNKVCGTALRVPVLSNGGAPENLTLF